jgi:hypothetical protein
MSFVVVCGRARTAPERIVGPFESLEAASRYCEEQPGPPERYAVVEPLTPPPADPPRGSA